MTAFNEITDHDVAWGDAGIKDAYELDSPYIQHILSLGLSKLHAITVAQTYDERLRILYKPYPPANREFLHEALNLANEPFDGVELSEFEQNSEEAVSHLYAPFVHESDTGPAEAWRWAHQHETRAAFIYANSQKWLRERGYVFLDRSRLDLWSVFQLPWEPPDITAAETEIDSYRASLSQWEKCPRRAQIYKLGGRGWWSPSDESKVVYPPGRNPLPLPDRGVGKTSQQAADDLEREISSRSPKERPNWQTWEPKFPLTPRMLKMLSQHSPMPFRANLSSPKAVL